ncbi:MAG: peptidase S8, partial [Caldilineaceae bacterium]|nr:peptidase S8 [Caldilineaceae bacterium]
MLKPVLVQLTLLCSLLLGLAHLSTQRAFAAADGTNGIDTATADTLLIHFAPDVTPAERDAMLAAMDVALVNWLAQIHVAEVRPNTALSAAAAGTTATTLPEILTRLSRQRTSQLRLQEAVLTIEENPVVQGVTLPNDPDLQNIDRSYGLSVTHSYEGWEYTHGSAEVIIAVLDTGLNLTHPEFAGRVIPGYDFINDDEEPLDDNGHGTHTAGIAAAGINNGLGMVGVCPGCRVMPVKVLNHNNAGTWSGVANGILYAADHGAKVINLSLGAAVSSQTLEDAIAYAQSKGVLIVAAAGNMGVEREFFPAAIEGVVAVSATDRQDRHWSLSNYGSYIDVAAPGYAIFSTYNDLNNYYRGYTYMSGTSMASPFVAGLAGLLFSQSPTRTATEVMHLIVSTTDQIGTSEEITYFGNGRINVARALAVASDSEWTQIVDGDDKDSVGTDPVSGEDDAEATTGELSNRIYLPVVAR